MGPAHLIAPMEILTPRFQLRELCETDATPRYLGWLANSAAQRFIAAAQHTHELAALAEYVRQRVNRPHVLFLGIFDQASGLHIGNIKYEPVDPAQGYAIMGILIGDPDYRGKGVAAEVLGASALWLKHHRAVRQILLGVSVDNPGAIRAYKKAGFAGVDTPHLKAPNASSLIMGLTL